MTTGMIQIKNLHKKFTTASGSFTALQDVSFQISKGQLVAVVGKSGSGKSTLLNMITGIDHPDSGQVIIDGTNVHDFDESKLATWRGAHIGIVFQFFQLIPTLSVLENILLAMDFVEKIPKSERESKAQKLLELVGISRHANKLPAALSGGEQQRAAIARALANDPPVLVADEPTGNLDSHNTKAIEALFKTLANEGKTILVVTHGNISEAGYDRILNLKDGVLVSDVKGSL